MIQFIATGTPQYRGIYFNSTNNFICITARALNIIDVFNLNLSINHNISTLTYQPKSIAAYNNQLYVGDFTSGTILVIENEVILHTFHGCNGNNVTLSYILFDHCGLMATACNHNELYLYYPNRTYVGKNFATAIYPKFIGYDSKGHLIEISFTRISIYN